MALHLILTTLINIATSPLLAQDVFCSSCPDPVARLYVSPDTKAKLIQAMTPGLAQAAEGANFSFYVFGEKNPLRMPDIVLEKDGFSTDTKLHDATLKVNMTIKELQLHPTSVECRPGVCTAQVELRKFSAAADVLGQLDTGREWVKANDLNFEFSGVKTESGQTIYPSATLNFKVRENGELVPQFDVTSSNFFIPPKSGSFTIKATERDKERGRQLWPKYEALIKKDPENREKYLFDFAAEVFSERFGSESSARTVLLSQSIFDQMVEDQKILDEISKRTKDKLAEAVQAGINKPLASRYDALTNLELLPPGRVQDYLDRPVLQKKIAEMERSLNEYIQQLNKGGSKKALTRLEKAHSEFQSLRCNFSGSSDEVSSGYLKALEHAWMSVRQDVESSSMKSKEKKKHLEYIDALIKGIRSDYDKMDLNALRVQQEMNLKVSVEKLNDIMELKFYRESYCPPPYDETPYQELLKSGDCAMVSQLNIDAINNYLSELNKSAIDTSGGQLNFYNPCYVWSSDKTCGCYNNRPGGLLWAQFNNGAPQIQWDASEVDPNNGQKGMYKLHIPPLANNVPFACEKGVDVYFSVQPCNGGSVCFKKGRVITNSRCLSLFQKAVDEVMDVDIVQGLLEMILFPIRAVLSPMESMSIASIVHDSFEDIEKNGLSLRSQFGVKRVVANPKSLSFCVAEFPTTPASQLTPPASPQSGGTVPISSPELPQAETPKQPPSRSGLKKGKDK